MGTQITAHKVLLGMYEKIIAGEIASFEQLVDEANSAGLEQQHRNAVVSRGYRLLKKFTWGMFAVINPREYKQLWQQLVVPHPQFKAAGDLKRSMTISSIFIGMLDIHGYTAFCRESKTNLSRLHELDAFFSTTIQEVAALHGCVGNRERGDEILLVAARAVDILRASFDIIQIFAKQRFFKEMYESAEVVNYSKILPPFQISAGISGGNMNTPMIITRRGEISGFLLNMAARLQARANKLAPRNTKIIMAKTVMTGLEKELAGGASTDLPAVVKFFDCGSIQFKGMSIPNVEAVFRSEERYKMKLQDSLQTLLTSLKQNLWKDKVMLDLLELMMQTVFNIPRFNLEILLPGNGSVIVNNEQIQQRLTMIRNLFGVQEDYTTAIAKLDETVHICSQIPAFEPIVVEYGREIALRYRKASALYAIHLEPAILKRKKEIFTEQEARLFDYFRAHRGTLERLEEKARRSPAVSQKRQMWNSVLEKLRSELDFSLYSGKR